MPLIRHFAKLFVTGNDLIALGFSFVVAFATAQEHPKILDDRAITKIIEVDEEEISVA